MDKRHQHSRGFTLIAALLLTILLSGVAVGLLYMVSNEARMGGNDLEGNLAYYAAEAQIENLTSELSQLYQGTQVPSATSINALSSLANQATQVPGSNIANITYGSNGACAPNMICWPTTQTNGAACPNPPNPCGSWDIVGAGQDQGMVATLIPFTLNVTATRTAGSGQDSTDTAAATGAAVNLTRTVEVALLPAFEFGIFCDGDCDYFAGPPFNFGGRVHANGNLFLAANSGPLTFTDKLTAVGQVITSQLENGTAAGSGAGSYNGTVYIPNAAGGCPDAPNSGPGTGSNCIALSAGSWTGGFPPTGAANPGWTGISKTTFNGFVENGLTGATKLQLPFVNTSKVGAIDIIRKPTPGDSTQVHNSRLYTEASIRILLADTEADLYPGETRSDSASQDIQIGTPFTYLGNSTGYVTVAQGAPGVTASNMYFATAKPHSGTNDWVTAPTGCGTPASWPLFGEVTVSGNLCKGTWLRVEYLNSSGNWVGVTTQWLSYGFGRNYNTPPTHPYNSSTTTAPLCQNYPTYPAGQCQNGISPAILILQQLQSGMATTKAYETDATDSSGTAYNWLPINFYDAREGEPRDVRPSGDPGTSCSPVGIMNAVELDVGNLWLWLQASGPYSAGSGKQVSATTYNGYILYFADHRGMLTDQYPLTAFYNGFSGMSGLNDIVNSGSSVGVPDGKLEAITYYLTATVPYSPEDTAVKGAAVNSGNVDRWGEANLGAGFAIPSASMALPYYIYGNVTANAVTCYSSSLGTATAEWNMVTGPRHVLRLVDGGMDSAGNSYVPPTNGNTTNNGNGFTVASEEPVYVWGNYNTGSADPFWPSENTLTTPHSAAAIIADAVTLLSNPPANNTAPATNTGWTDVESFEYPASITNRPGNTSYYRMAIIAGKSIPFPNPSWSTEVDFGTDGGMHNFLRYLENRGANSAVVNYAGSMISMYYSQYATGNFKCCTSVYGAPTRNYFFDTEFENPNNLPPGTPSFQDVVSLGYHQSFIPQ
jgi:PilX N-terminal